MSDSDTKVQNFERGERLRTERARIGLTVVTMASIGGVSKGSQILYEKGNPPTADYLEAIEQAGADVLFILTGRKDPSLPHNQVGFMRSLSPEWYASQFVSATKQTLPSPKIELIAIEGSDYARIPLHDAKLSAGPGETNEDTIVIDHMAFRQDWLRRIDVKPENALMARIAGDSMAPAIQSGDLVMIDKTRRDVPAFKKTRLPQQLPIFAFRQDDQARVKRLERRVKEKLLILYSDNPTMPAEVLGEGDVHTLEILGQVVWSGHVWR